MATPLKNASYTTISGLTVTQSGSTPTNKTQKLSAGTIKSRTTGALTTIAVDGTGVDVATITNANKRRVDIIVYETKSGSTGTAKVAGTEYDYNLTITAITASSPASGYATVTTQLAHNLAVGEKFTISGTSGVVYDGTYTVVSTPTSTSVVFVTSVTGTSTLTSAKLLNYSYAAIDPAQNVSATQIPVAFVGVNYDGTTVNVETPIDARSTPTYQGVRAFNRSQNVRIGGQKVTPSANAFVDLDDPKATKEYSYHSAIGSVFPIDNISDWNDAVVVFSGGVTATPATMSGLTAVVVTVSAGELRNRDNQSYITLNGTGSTYNTTASNTVPAIAYTASTSFASALDSTNTTGYILVYANVYTGVVSVAKSTPAPLASAVVPTTPVNCVPLALITASYAATNGTTVITDLRPRI